MKIVNLGLLLLLLLASCSAYLQEPDFGANIEKCYFQNWVSGVRDGGRGINFFIVLKNDLPNDSELLKVQFNQYEANFVPLDSLHFAAYIILKKGENAIAEDEIPNEVETQLHHDQARIFYRLKGKVYSVIVYPSEQEIVPYP